MTIKLAEALSIKWSKKFCWVESSMIPGWYIRGARKPAHRVSSVQPGTHDWSHITELQMMRLIVQEVRWTDYPSELLRPTGLETAQNLRDTEWLLRCLLWRTAQEMERMVDDTP